MDAARSSLPIQSPDPGRSPPPAPQFRAHEGVADGPSAQLVGHDVAGTAKMLLRGVREEIGNA